MTISTQRAAGIWALAAAALAVGATCARAEGDPPAPRLPSAQLVTLDFPPLEFADDKGAVQGAVVDIVKEALHDAGYQAEIQLLPWTRSLTLVKDGRADAIFTAYKNPEREAFLDYSQEILIPQVVSLYIRKGSPFKFGGDFAELKGKTIGIVSTISYGKIFDDARVAMGLKTERVEALDLNFKKLMAGRVDYVISNRYSAEVEIEKLKIDPAIEELLPPVEVTPSYIAFSKKTKTAGLRDKFDKALLAMKKSGRYQEILLRWKVRVPKEGT